MRLVKHLSGFFVCMSLIIPFPVYAGEILQFSVNDPLPMPDNASHPSDTSIWLAGVGEGFRSGTQVLGFSAGATYGILAFGGLERHHLSLITVSYGHMIGGMKGADSWYRGNWELRGELFSGAQVNSDTCWVIGVTPHLRFNFATSTRWVPYADVGAGITLTDIGAPDLSGAFQFNLQAIAGVNYFIRDCLAINLEGRYLHLSNANISKPNYGVNTAGGFIGVNTFF